MSGYYIIIGLSMLVSWLVQQRLKSKIAHYSQQQLQNGLSGKEIAQRMLQDHGLHHVQVISVPGQLTDHYNPADQTVNLSEAVYDQRNAAAAAVAAHECGHAVQHATSYAMLGLRSRLVPVVNIAANLNQFILMAGIGLMAANFGKTVLLIGVLLFAITTLFSIVTLPVEYDASHRALAWLKNKNMLATNEYEGAEDSLKWAARTYLVAALGSLAQLLYFASMLLNDRRRD